MMGLALCRETSSGLPLIQRYDCRPLTLDENALSQYLTISQEHRRATSNYRYVRNNSYNQLSGRYNDNKPPQQDMGQVWCREGLSERCYWEVSWRGATWSVAVFYKDGSRTKDLEFGTDNKSWSFVCSPYSYAFRHNNGSKAVSGPQSSSVGVYLDYKLGTLSFYDISNSMTLLHKEHIKFTEPVYPGFELKNTESKDNLTSYYAELKKLW